MGSDSEDDEINPTMESLVRLCRQKNVDLETVSQFIKENKSNINFADLEYNNQVATTLILNGSTSIIKLLISYGLTMTPPALAGAIFRGASTDSVAHIIGHAQDLSPLFVGTAYMYANNEMRDLLDKHHQQTLTGEDSIPETLHS